MLKLLVFSVAVAGVWGLPPAGKPTDQRSRRPVLSGRIVGGQNADIADYPYQLALTNDGSFWCGGVLIGSKWALTAAHCTDGQNASNLQVIAGSTDLTGGQTVQVAAFHQNPNFNFSAIDYDISVLELAEEVTVENSAPIALHRCGYTAKDGEDVTTTGYGFISEDGPLPGVLQAVVNKVVNHDVCNEAYKDIRPVTDRMACAGILDEGGKGACSGDSGGPVVVDGKLYGTVSFSRGCARAGYPTVNSRISDPALRRYIRRITGL